MDLSLTREDIEELPVLTPSEALVALAEGWVLLDAFGFTVRLADGGFFVDELGGHRVLINMDGYKKYTSPKPDVIEIRDLKRMNEVFATEDFTVVLPEGTETKNWEYWGSAVAAILAGGWVEMKVPA